MKIRGVLAGEGRGLWLSQFCRKLLIFGKFNASSENFRTFPVSKGKRFEFYRKIIDLAHPTLQVPRRP